MVNLSHLGAKFEIIQTSLRNIPLLSLSFKGSGFVLHFSILSSLLSTSISIASNHFFLGRVFFYDFLFLQVFLYFQRQPAFFLHLLAIVLYILTFTSFTALDTCFALHLFIMLFCVFFPCGFLTLSFTLCSQISRPDLTH